MKKILLGLGLAVFVLGATSASAATIAMFDVCNTATLCNQLSLTSTLNAGAIDVHVSAPADYGIFGDSGANRAFGFNVNGSVAGLAITNLTSGFSVGPTNGQVNGYGFFEYLIDGPHTGSGSFLPLDFTVTRTGGFSSDLGIFETNTAGYIFASHIRNEETGLTGFVAVDQMPTSQTPVPEPATMVLLGTGLLAAFRARRS